jgi:alkanesulfonate monooxygenase SsuD/methylene tetrahydromethanopterin reductase-like flavin-dependent oxidoreductase (luciferase family)
MDDLALGLYTSGTGWTYEQLRTVWRRADALGFATAQLMDNAVGPDARGPGPAVPEAYVTLAALAEATERIRIGPLATPIGRRHPALLAKMAAMLDRVSGGRLLLTLGTGDDPRHFEPWGMELPPLRERVAQLDEAIDVIDGLWTEPRFSHDGPAWQLADAVLAPKPVQRPRPPIWIGLAEGRRVMPRIAAAKCDGVNVYNGSDERAGQVLAALDAACAAAGRDPGELARSRHVLVTLADDEVDLARLRRDQARALDVPLAAVESAYDWLCHVAGPPDAVIAGLKRQRELGFDHLALQFQLPGDPLGGLPDSTLAAIERFSAEVAPALGGPPAP